MSQADIPDFIVVGSSFSGVATGRILIKRGFSVLMLDGGQDLDAVRQRKIASAQVSLTLKKDFNYAEGYRDIADGQLAVIDTQAEQLSNKAQFGSQYCYEGSNAFCGFSTSDEVAHLFGSLAVGGLSNAWGLSSLPYSDGDIYDWPISRQDLHGGYRECLEWMPIFSMGPTGNIDEVLSGDAYYLPFRNSYFDEAGIRLQDQILRHSESLKAARIYSSASRLALSAEGAHLVAPCSKCGMCLDGCLHKCLFSTRPVIDALKGSEKFSYQSGFVVREFREDASGVDVVSEGGRKLRARALILGAGSLHTTHIVGRSLGWEGREVTLKDSRYWLTPFLSSEKLTFQESTQGISLSHTFLEIVSSGISPKMVHVQMYGSNEPLKKKIEEKLSLLPKYFRELSSRKIYSHAGLLQGFLHSDDSPDLRLRFVAREGTLGLEIAGISNEARSRRVLADVRKLLTTQLKRCGLWSLNFATQDSLPGRGFHSGSTLAMSSAPDWSGSDLLGRPQGLRRVHCVDSSVLPSIAAPTITFTVAANASRIGATIPAP